MACGSNTSFALSDEGKPFSSGLSDFGQLDNHMRREHRISLAFGVHVNSYPFHAAPGEIMNTLIRLAWAGQKAVAMTEDVLKSIKDKTAHYKARRPPDKGTKDNTAEGVIPTEFEPFNEELVLGYFQGSNIGLRTPTKSLAQRLSKRNSSTLGGLPAPVVTANRGQPS
ncbi:hypothetical protein Hte_003756 [Hypoxylon texense]